MYTLPGGILTPIHISLPPLETFTTHSGAGSTEAEETVGGNRIRCRWTVLDVLFSMDH